MGFLTRPFQDKKRLCTKRRLIFTASLRHLAGKGERKNLLRQTCRCELVGCRFALEPPLSSLVRRSFNEGGTPLSFSKTFYVRFFFLRFSQKKKKRDISFEIKDVPEENARICLNSEKVERLHGNTGGFDTQDLQGNGWSRA
ncbi:MAG: hypothetical protein IJC34_05495 [Lentisphaeria bacterium]|nr:hypothetical protein [Lentisphaeria bacterium]